MLWVVVLRVLFFVDMEAVPGIQAVDLYCLKLFLRWLMQINYHDTRVN